MTTKAPARRPVTFDHLAKKKPVERELYIPINDEAREDVEKAQEELGLANAIGDPDRVAKAQATLEGKLTVFRNPENSICLRLRALGRVRFDEMKKQHQPTEGMLKEAKETGGDKPGWNPETFLAPLIAATVVEPEMTPDQVRLLTVPVEDGGLGWNDGEISQVFNECLAVNLVGNIGRYSF